MICLATGIAWACGGSSDDEKKGGGDDDSDAGQSGEAGTGGSRGGSAGSGARGGTAGSAGEAGADTGGRAGSAGRGGTTSGGTAGTLGGEGGEGAQTPGGAGGAGGDDPCDPNPCQNGGTCRDNSGTAACTCINGYTGSRCQTPGILEGCTTTCGTLGMRGCETPGMNCGACTAPEACNACDDDGLNGVDDTFTCARGQRANCMTTCNTAGTRTCANDCSGYGACTATEVCNGCDDDGVMGIDNGFACARLATEACTTTCNTPGMHACANDCSGYGRCNGTEVCNGCDDDGTGGPDNGFTCVQNQASACTTACGTPGTRTCNGTCTGYSTCLAAAETCGNACDDDGVGGADDGCIAVPANDNFANATTITLGSMETTVQGTTLGATRDGATVSCSCTSLANVWYRFVVPALGVVWFDTAGSTYDTSLFITDSAGTPVPAQTQNGITGTGLCNDDSGCAVSASGWTDTLQSRTFGNLTAGTYYLSVSGCQTGAFTLHAQFVANAVGSFFYSTRLTGNTTTSTFLVGTSASTSTCGGTASGEDVRWMATCGGGQEFFSLCQSDGGTFTRSNGTLIWDPSMYVMSAQSGTQLVCNDDGGTAGGTNCVGTGGDTNAYGSRINNVVVTRGLTTVFVDERVGGAGMGYTLRYTVPN